MASQKTTKSIIVRNINGELHRLLKETAQRRHRSVSSLILCLIEDWAKNREEVLLPADNLKEAEGLPSYVLDGIKLTPVSTIGEVIAMSLVSDTSGGTQNGPR